MTERNFDLALPRGVKVTPMALKITRRLSYDEWAHLGAVLQAMHRNVLWWIGDHLVWGEDAFNQEFSQVIGDFAKQTQYNAMWVSRRVDFSRRREISWSHHAEIAALEPEEQDKFLEAAVKNEWNTRELREAVRAFKSIEAPEAKENDWQEPAEAPAVVNDGSSSSLEVEDNQRVIDVQSVSQRAIEFIRNELQGATDQDLLRVVGAIVSAFAESSGSLDNDGFDWAAGAQDDGVVPYLDGNGDLRHAASVESAWREIKSEAARRKQ